MYNFLKGGFALVVLVSPQMAVIVPHLDVVTFTTQGQTEECSHFGREASTEKRTLSCILLINLNRTGVGK